MDLIALFLKLKLGGLPTSNDDNDDHNDDNAWLHNFILTLSQMTQ